MRKLVALMLKSENDVAATSWGTNRCGLPLTIEVNDEQAVHMPHLCPAPLP